MLNFKISAIKTRRSESKNKKTNKIKHHETFWITVENQMHDGKEYYMYKEIEHTKNPNIPQFDVLLGQGEINLDLMLGRPSGHGDTYSFKIKKRAIPLLFPESVKYTI